MPETIEPHGVMSFLSRAATGEALESNQARTAAHFALRELAQRCPGHNVEVQVPFTGAVQINRRLAHRRGTLPNVAEIEVGVLLGLVVGSMTQNDAERSGKTTALGAWADLGPCFPLFTDATLGRWTE